MERIWKNEWVKQYLSSLKEAERSTGTMNKYHHDLQVFGCFIGEGNPLYKEDVIAYK